MRPRNAVLALISALLLPMALAGRAAAGGPTSVLLVVPGEGRTASLYTGQADYETLAEQVGAFGDTGARSSTDVVDRGTSTEVTVTWLIHDVSVGRVDRIYPDAPGGPSIATQTSIDGSPDIWSSPVQWHTATQGTVLIGRLTRLGLSPGAGDVQPAVTPTPTARAATAATATRSTAADGASGPVWGAAGLALGVLLTARALWVARRRHHEPDEPEKSEPTTRPSDDVLTSTGARLRR
jgi:hypothetical protein